jgi:hypothetical protein
MGPYAIVLFGNTTASNPLYCLRRKGHQADQTAAFETHNLNAFIPLSRTVLPEKFWKSDQTF